MHPVTFFWHSEPFYVPVCVRVVGKTITMFCYDTAIFESAYQPFFFNP
jgi:hypothetical protein